MRNILPMNGPHGHGPMVTWAIPTGVVGLGQGPSGGSGTWHNSSSLLQDQCPFPATTHGFEPDPSHGRCQDGHYVAGAEDTPSGR